MSHNCRQIAALTAFTALIIDPATAANIESLYTDLDIDTCLVLHADDFGATFACPGYKGYPLWVAEGDLRFFVSYGFGAPNEKAASQTLAPFNIIHSKLEWRVTNAEGDWKPFATILRWYTDNPEDSSDPDKGETLIVTKLEDGNTCHIAHIDAKAIPDANALAQEIADRDAKNFDCATSDPLKIP